MATGVVAGFILCIPIAILMLISAVFLVILTVLFFKKGNKILAIILIMLTLFPLSGFLILVVMMAIYVFGVLVLFI